MYSLPKHLAKPFVGVDIESPGLDVERCGILEVDAVDTVGRRLYRRMALDLSIFTSTLSPSSSSLNTGLNNLITVP